LLWLELLRDDCNVTSEQLDWLLAEADELIAIFVTMSRKVKKRMDKTNGQRLRNGAEG